MALIEGVNYLEPARFSVRRANNCAITLPHNWVVDQRRPFQGHKTELHASLEPFTCRQAELAWIQTMQNLQWTAQVPRN